MLRVGRGIVSLVAVIAAAGALAGCSGGGKSASGPAVAPATSSETVLALGGSATEGDGVRDRLTQAWPYLVFHDALPLSAVFVNGAIDGATVARAVETQVPLARELKPDIVEVLLGADDLEQSTPITDFTAQLTQLVSTLRADGAKRILVADLPAAYGSKATPYNRAIHSVVTASHTELVPLAGAAITLAPTDGLPPQPDAASHRLIAAAFTARIRGG